MWKYSDLHGTYRKVSPDEALLKGQLVCRHLVVGIATICSFKLGTNIAVTKFFSLTVMNHPGGGISVYYSVFIDAAARGHQRDICN